MLKQYRVVKHPFIASLLTLHLLFSQSLQAQSVQISKTHPAGLGIFSGDRQHVKAGRELKHPVRVWITSVDSLGTDSLRVLFRFVSWPDKAGGFTLTPGYAPVDSEGMASTRVMLGDTEGEYELSASVLGDTGQQMVFFKLYARPANWVVKLIIGLIGGLAFFLFGMSVMGKGLQKSAGNRMRAILGRLTHNRFLALTAGAVITMVIQSSSATSVMLVSFVNAGLMRFRQTIGMLLGAAIGSTITAQIIAFKLTDYSLLIFGVGFFMHFLFKRQAIKHIGEAIMGFGILFFGMFVMSESMYPLRSFEPFLSAMANLENPLLGIVAGTLLTALIQSSSAFVGIMIILASQGLLSLHSAIPLLIGSNLGTVVTSVIASLGSSRESKKVALAFVIFKATGALLLIFFIPEFTRLIEVISPQAGETGNQFDQVGQALPRQIANAHTIYNLLLAFLFLPFVGYFERLVDRMMPVRKLREEVTGPLYLDRSMLATPSLALGMARKELVVMMVIVRSMAEKVIGPFVSKNPAVLDELIRSEEQVNHYRDEINDYLLQVSRQSGSNDTVEEAFQLMYAVKEFEQIADVVAGSMAAKARSWCTSGYHFSDEGREELLVFHRYTLEQLELAIGLYQSPSGADARQVKSRYKELRNLTFNLEKQHFNRLKSAIGDSLESSKTHLELMAMCRQIASHATNTARVLLKGSEIRYKEPENDNQSAN